jgi:hypothetical protein
LICDRSRVNSELVGLPGDAVMNAPTVALRSLNRLPRDVLLAEVVK